MSLFFNEQQKGVEFWGKKWIKFSSFLSLSLSKKKKSIYNPHARARAREKNNVAIARGRVPEDRRY
jgi:hypothetical protein